MLRHVALIPARGGSKGIPGKNIRPLAGKPLIAWTIEAAAACPEIDHVYVATDSAEIRRTVQSLGLDRVSVVDRAAETATDEASTESVMEDFLERHCPAGVSHLVLIQATSPMLETRHLTEGIRRLVSRGADSLVSVCRQTRFIWREQDGDAIPVNYDPASRPRRQDFAGQLVENGAFYVSCVSGLRRTGCRLHGRMVTYEMEPETYVEIDEPEDLLVVESMLRRRARRDGIDRLAGVKLVLLDVDGVLTDGGMYYGPDGEALKKFDTRDGMGIARLREAGIEVGLVTGEDSAVVAARAKKLGLTEVHLGVKDKRPSVNAILERLGIPWSALAYMGDDLNDVEVLTGAGVAATVPGAQPEVKQLADLVTRAHGGNGAVREFAERILAARVEAKVRGRRSAPRAPVSFRPVPRSVRSDAK